MSGDEERGGERKEREKKREKERGRDEKGGGTEGRREVGRPVSSQSTQAVALQSPWDQDSRPLPQ